MPDPVITGPSNTGPDPVVTLGPVAAPVVRTTGQGLTGGLIVETLVAFDVVHFTDRQYGLALLWAGILLCFVQNVIEARVGRRLVGAAR